MSQNNIKSIDLPKIQAAALSAAANGIVITDNGGFIIWANPAVSKITGYSNEELLGKKTSILNSGIHDKAFYQEMWGAIQSGKVWRGHVINRKKDGSLYHEEMTITPVLDNDGKIINFFAVKEDVTAIRKAAEELEASEERFRRLINTVHAHFYMSEVSPEGVFVNRYVSDNFITLTGYPSEKFMRDWGFWQTLIHPEDQAHCQQTAQRIYEGYSTESEYRIIRADGEVIWVSDNAQVNKEANGRMTVSATILDITERKETENHIRYLATHDPLTGLPNRILFQEILEHNLIYAGRNQEKMAVFFLDVDDFKFVNDTYGHHVGDALLQSIAERLKNNMRGYDTISRISGDEFTLIAEQIQTIENAHQLAHKIYAFLSGQYQIEEHTIKVQISIGGSVFPDHGDNFETLLQKADAAMYAAKKSTDTIRIYSVD